MQKQIDYSDIKKLGFKEIDGNCSSFYNQYGFEYKVFEYKLTKNLILDWDQLTRRVSLMRVNSESSIKNKMYVDSLKDLKKIISFFIKDASKGEFISDEEDNDNTPNHYITTAC